jgi:hypothetical protein
MMEVVTLLFSGIFLQIEVDDQELSPELYAVLFIGNYLLL